MDQSEFLTKLKSYAESLKKEFDGYDEEATYEDGGELYNHAYAEGRSSVGYALDRLIKEFEGTPLQF